MPLANQSSIIESTFNPRSINLQSIAQIANQRTPNSQISQSPINEPHITLAKAPSGEAFVGVDGGVQLVERHELGVGVGDEE